MIKLLRKLLGLCEHNYEIIDTDLVEKYHDKFYDTHPYRVYRIYTQKCTKCGRIRTFKTKL